MWYWLHALFDKNWYCALVRVRCRYNLWVIMKKTFRTRMLLAVFILLIFVILSLSSSSTFALQSLEVQTLSSEQNNTLYQAETPTAKKVKPTRTPKPTITPPAIPPPQDDSQTNLMILFGVLTVIIIIIGVWINRGRRASSP